jgi:hypothetical protein
LAFIATWNFVFETEPGAKGCIRDLDYPAEAHLKNNTWAVRLSILKIPHFRRFGENSLLDNTIGIQYLSPSCRLPKYGCYLISGPTNIEMLSATVYIFKSPLFGLRKGNFYHFTLILLKGWQFF